VRLRIGSRGSRLALAQAEEIAALLRNLGHEVAVVPMTTAGDRGASPAASPTGTKGLFVAEITEALARGDVDLAVHSAKDLPSDDPPGIEVAAVPQRSLPYDVLVARVEPLPGRPVVGTSSLRRRAQLIRMHPEAAVHDLRGNVDTRLRRMADGELDAVVLAAAGLSRLELSPEHLRPLPVDEMVPAPGQGALAVQARAGDEAVEAARAIDHAASRTAFETERRVVALLGGGCRLPLGAYAEIRDRAIRLLAVVVRPDGSDLLWSQVEGDEAGQVAGEAAETLLAAGAGAILADLGS
jgi:hydroxymethylbilane synthase